jgi:hypothetical protein
MCPLYFPSLGRCGSDRCVQTLYRIQAVDNHNIYCTRKILGYPVVLWATWGNPSFAHPTRHMGRIKYEGWVAKFERG